MINVIRKKVFRLKENRVQAILYFRAEENAETFYKSKM